MLKTEALQTTAKLVQNSYTLHMIKCKKNM